MTPIPPSNDSGVLLRPDEPGPEVRSVPDAAFVGDEKSGAGRRASAETLVRDLFENSPDAVMHVLASGEVLYANPAATSLLGRRLDELRRLRWTDLITPIVDSSIDPDHETEESERCEGDNVGTTGVVEPASVRVSRRVVLTPGAPHCEVEIRHREGSSLTCEIGVSSPLGPGCDDERVVVFRNVSERGNNERRLREREEQLRLALSGGGLGLWDWNARTGKLDVNERWMTMLGLDAASPRPSIDSWHALVHPDDMPILDRLVAEVIMNPQGREFEAEIRARHANGHYIWIHDKGAVVSRAPDGSPRRIVGTHRDISRRKQNEEALRSSEERYRTLTTELNVGVLIQSATAEILLSNPKALELLGLTESQLVGRTSLDPSWNVIQENGIPFPGHLHPVPRSIATKQPILGVVMGVFRPTRGDRVWLHVNANPQLDADGNVRQVICTFSDITEHKAAQERLRLNDEYLSITLRSIGDGVIATDVSGRITRMNPTAERLTGWALEDARQRPLLQVFKTNGRITPGTRSNDDRVDASPGLSAHTNGTVLFARNGQQYQIAVTPSAILDDAGRVLGTVVVFRDVTEEFRVKQALSSTAAFLERTGELAKVGGWELDLESQTLIWSREVFRLLDLEPTYVPTIDTMLQFYTPEARREMAAALEAARSIGESWNLELPAITAGGRSIWVRTQGSAVLNEGRPIKLVGAFKDISEQKLAEIALKESEARYRAIAEGSPEPTAVHREGRLIYVNPAGVASLSATSRDALLGRPILDFVHPDFHRITLERVQRINEGGTDSPFGEMRFVAADGRVIDVEAHGIRFLFEGAPAIQVTWHDITLRKNAERALRESEASLQATLDALPDLLFELTLSGRYVRFHASREELLSAPPELFVGKLVTEVLPAESAGIVLDALRDAHLSGYSSGRQVFLATPNGRRWFELSVARKTTPIDDEPRFVVLSRDITERKLAESALQESQARTKLLIQAADIGLWDWNLETGEVYYSPEWKGQIGYRDDEIAHRLDEWEKRVHPLDLEPTLALVQEFRIGKRDTYNAEFRLRHRDGSWRWILAQADASRDATGHATRLMGCHIDITERKRTEEALLASQRRFHAIHVRVSVPMAINDEKQRISFLNPAFVSTFGYTHDDLPTLNEWWALAYPDAEYRKTVVDAWGSELERINQTGTEFEPIEVYVRCKNGSTKVVLAAASTPSSTLEGSHLIVLYDISDRKLAQQELQASLREKEALLREVHHRVKNNLQVITSLLRLETGRSAHPETKVALRNMQGRIRSMALLHETLYRTGTFEAVDLGSYLTQLSSSSFRTQIERPGAIDLTLNLTSAAVVMDQAIACGLLVNELISNGLKHGFPEGRTGEIKVELVRIEEGSKLRLKVSDSGVGLPDDMGARQANSLGLQLASDLAIQIGGRLDIVETHPATFVVEFLAVEPKRPSSRPES